MSAKCRKLPAHSPTCRGVTKVAGTALVTSPASLKRDVKADRVTLAFPN